MDLLTDQLPACDPKVGLGLTADANGVSIRQHAEFGLRWVGETPSAEPANLNRSALVQEAVEMYKANVQDPRPHSNGLPRTRTR